MRYTHYSLGGEFIVTEVAAEKVGDSHQMMYARETPRAAIDRISVQIDGAWSYRNEDDVELHLRLPGMISSELGDTLSPGKYRFVAVDANARHYCIRRRNSTEPLAADPLRVAAGNPFSIPQGKWLFLARGQIEIGGVVHGERLFLRAETKTLDGYAVTDILGLLL